MMSHRCVALQKPVLWLLKDTKIIPCALCTQTHSKSALIGTPVYMRTLIGIHVREGKVRERTIPIFASLIVPLVRAKAVIHKHELKSWSYSGTVLLVCDLTTSTNVWELCNWHGKWLGSYLTVRWFRDYIVQWNSSNPDNNGTEESVHIREVS